MSSKSVKQLITWLPVLGMLLLSAPLLAEEEGASRKTRSITISKATEPDMQAKDVLLKQAAIVEGPQLEQQGFRFESTVMAARFSETENINHDYVRVYDTETTLISDFDHDGFYHRYSVEIDADTVFEMSYIYVDLYLSYEGGPWNYYASSENYHIYGDSEMDRFVIETELADGYPPGYYDVRIEVYDADSEEWLTSYGPYQDAALSALPLEDSYYDDTHSSIGYQLQTEVVVADHHGGSISWSLMALPLLLSMRLLSRRSQ